MIRIQDLEMHVFFANLMSAILLLQAVFGCCWHNACEDSAHPALSNIGAAEGCCCHSHSRQQAPKPHKCELKCFAARIFIPTQKTLVDSPDSMAYLTVLLIEPRIQLSLRDCFWRGWMDGSLDG